MVGVNSVANAAPIAAAAAHAGKTVPVAIDVNVGVNRAGDDSRGEPVLELANAVTAR